jgi:3-dehydroquinate dehydratase type I
VKPLICVALTCRDAEQTITRVRELSSPDLIEIRFDYGVEPIHPSRIRDVTDAQLIATNRPAYQGGLSKEAEEGRLGTLYEACEAGFEYADVELAAPGSGDAVKRVHDAGSRCILSHHDFIATPTLEEFNRLHAQAELMGADVVKLVGTANCYGDNMVYLAYLLVKPGNVSFGMGLHGVPSRVLSPLMGGAFTYASTGEGEESAPGQLTLQKLRELYEAMGIEP